MWHFSFFDNWFLSLICHELLEEFLRKYFLHIYLHFQKHLKNSEKCETLCCQENVTYYLNGPLVRKIFGWMFWMLSSYRWDVNLHPKRSSLTSDDTYQTTSTSYATGWRLEKVTTKWNNDVSASPGDQKVKTTEATPSVFSLVFFHQCFHEKCSCWMDDDDLSYDFTTHTRNIFVVISEN